MPHFPPQPSRVHQRDRRGRSPPWPARRRWPSAQAAASRGSSRPRAGGPDPDLVVVNAKVYTMDTRAPRAEAFAVTGGRFTAVGSTSRHQGPGRQEHADLRRQGHDGRARLHRLPQPRRRRGAAVRGAGRQSVRGRVRQHPQHRRQAARARPQQTPAGHLGGGLLLRRHQGEGQARADHPRPRRGVERASGDRPPPRRPHLLLQQQGLRDGRHHQGHAQPDGRHLRQGRERRAERTRHRPRLGAVQQGRHAADLHAGAARAARARRHRPHLQAVRALRPDQRAPRGRQPAGDAGRARPRRAAAPHQLRGQRPRARRDDRRRHPDRLRRRVDQVRRHLRAHGRRLVLGADDGAEHAVSGRDAALQGQRHRDAGRR